VWHVCNLSVWPQARFDQRVGELLSAMDAEIVAEQAERKRKRVEAEARWKENKRVFTRALAATLEEGAAQS
jgi:hypothetical protein